MDTRLLGAGVSVGVEDGERIFDGRSENVRASIDGGA
jgi:hypothetical protein